MSPGIRPPFEFNPKIRYRIAIMTSSQALDAHPNDAVLSDLLDEALNSFGATCFWNVPTSGLPQDFAAVAVRKLRKHGGMAGWRLAQRIDAAIAASSHGPH